MIPAASRSPKVSRPPRSADDARDHAGSAAAARRAGTPAKPAARRRSCAAPPAPAAPQPTPAAERDRTTPAHDPPLRLQAEDRRRERKNRAEDNKPRAIPLRPPMLGRGAPIHPPVGPRPSPVAPAASARQRPPCHLAAARPRGPFRRRRGRFRRLAGRARARFFPARGSRCRFTRLRPPPGAVRPHLRPQPAVPPRRPDRASATSAAASRPAASRRAHRSTAAAHPGQHASAGPRPPRRSAGGASAGRPASRIVGQPGCPARGAAACRSRRQARPAALAQPMPGHARRRRAASRRAAAPVSAASRPAALSGTAASRASPPWPPAPYVRGMPGPGSVPAVPRPMHPTSRGGLARPRRAASAARSYRRAPSRSPTSDRARPARSPAATPKKRSCGRRCAANRPRRRPSIATSPFPKASPSRSFPKSSTSKPTLVIKKLVDRGIFATINQTLDAKLATEHLARIRRFHFHRYLRRRGHAGYRDRRRGRPIFPPSARGHHHGPRRSRQNFAPRRHPRPPTSRTKKPAASRSTSALITSITTARTSSSSIRRATKRSPACAPAAPKLPISWFWSSPPTTASCRRPSKPSITPAPRKFRSSSPSTRSTSPTPSPTASNSSSPIAACIAEDWGGDTVMVPVSARSKTNLDLLLEMILLVAEIAGSAGQSRASRPWPACSKPSWIAGAVRWPPSWCATARCAWATISSAARFSAACAP